MGVLLPHKITLLINDKFNRAFMQLINELVVQLVQFNIYAIVPYGVKKLKTNKQNQNRPYHVVNINFLFCSMARLSRDYATRFVTSFLNTNNFKLVLIH
jgi:hypothetical protein